MHIITWHDACLGKGRMIIWLHLVFLRGKIGGWYDRIERSSAKCDGAMEQTLTNKSPINKPINKRREKQWN